MRLAGRYRTVAIEIATTSKDYAWEPSGEVAAADKVTLFSGQSFDEVHPLRRYWSMLRATWRCRVVCIGISYAEPDAVLLSWTLRLLGKRVVVFSESKFDDRRRSTLIELAKSAVLACYSAAVVGGRRHMDYFHFLRFVRRTVLPGYDVVGLDRIRAQGGGLVAPHGPDHADRPFVFIGRFVEKKNLVTLVRSFARYCELAEGSARRLILIGSGAAEPELRNFAGELGVADRITFPGFLSAPEVSRELAGALALVLVSREEQWGLVVNEALAFGLPCIVSNEVGSRDLLVRNLVNGFVVDSNSPDSIAEAMRELSSNRPLWERMVAASHRRAWMGDAGRLADAIECLLFPDAGQTPDSLNRLLAETAAPSS